MKVNQINLLIAIGATDRVRAHIKRLALKDRLPLLHDLVPYVNSTPSNLRFFQENFAQEIGALISAGYDYAKAEVLYNTAKQLKR
jgi:hypothetical protein